MGVRIRVEPWPDAFFRGLGNGLIGVALFAVLVAGVTLWLCL